MVNNFGNFFLGIKHPKDAKKRIQACCNSKTKPNNRPKISPSHKKKKLVQTQSQSSIAFFITLIQLVIYPLFKLWVANYIKYWILDFLSFKIISALAIKLMGDCLNFDSKSKLMCCHFFCPFLLWILFENNYFHAWNHCLIGSQNENWSYITTIK